MLGSIELCKEGKKYDQIQGMDKELEKGIWRSMVNWMGSKRKAKNNELLLMSTTTTTFAVVLPHDLKIWMAIRLIENLYPDLAYPPDEASTYIIMRILDLAPPYNRRYIIDQKRTPAWEWRTRTSNLSWFDENPSILEGVLKHLFETPCNDSRLT